MGGPNQPEKSFWLNPNSARRRVATTTTRTTTTTMLMMKTKQVLPCSFTCLGEDCLRRLETPPPPHHCCMHTGFLPSLLSKVNQKFNAVAPFWKEDSEPLLEWGLLWPFKPLTEWGQNPNSDCQPCSQSNLTVPPVPSPLPTS